MPKQFTDVRTARAKDLTYEDVIRIDGRWRTLYDVYSSVDDVLKVHRDRDGKLPDYWPELQNAAAKAFEDHDDGDYILVRYHVQETSDGFESRDALLVLDAYELIDVQTTPLFEHKE